MGISCPCQYVLSNQIDTDEIEEVKQEPKRKLDMSNIIKLQATWRGYSFRKSLNKELSQTIELKKINNNFQMAENNRESLESNAKLLEDGGIYNGDMNRDLREGFGTHTWPDGSTYEGD